MSMRKIVPKDEKPMTDTPSVSSDRPIYPYFRIELQHLPEAKKWDVGKEGVIAIKYKLVGKSISRYQNDVEFEIHGIDPDPKESDNEE